MTAPPVAPALRSPFGAFVLERRPPAAGRPLQAWDAADEYLLAELARELPALDGCAARTLAINDQFGALAIALHATTPYSWGDSRTAHLALTDNCARNALADTAHRIPATQPPLPPGAPWRVVLWRIPKALALFRQQAAWLQPHVDAGTLLLAGGMIKHLPPQAVDVLGALGRVDMLHAHKKARLFRVTPTDRAAPALPEERPLRIAELDLTLAAGANVFARDKFDIGARFFIEQFGRLPPARRIADLGCGNGVLGIALQRLRPDAHVAFFDESYQAVASAAANHAHNLPAGAAADFHCDDCLSHYAGPPFDLVVCNPPFHQNHAIGDQIARRMFAHSRRHLAPGGALWIVANRHLDYPAQLRQLFGNCRRVAANPKFVVLAATRA